MRSHFMEYRTTAGFALAFPVFAIAWLLTAPHGMAFLTVTVTALLAGAAGALALNSWRHVHATEALRGASHRTRRRPDFPRDGHLGRGSSWNTPVTLSIGATNEEDELFGDRGSGHVDGIQRSRGGREPGQNS